MKEKKAKQRWEEKYLSQEEQEAIALEEAEIAKEMAAKSKTSFPPRNEREAMALRLKAFDDEPEPPAASERVLPQYEVLRRKVAADVAASRPRSHRFTGDLSLESMLKDIGPALWISVNPNYAPTKLASSQHRAHIFDRKRGWGERVDKTHHLHANEFMKHAEKTLQLGEKPFLSGGMKIKPTL